MRTQTIAAGNGSPQYVAPESVIRHIECGLVIAGSHDTGEKFVEEEDYDGF